MKFVNVGGLTFHYRLDGQPQRQPLVFINALGTDLRIWDDVITSLAEPFTVLRFDKRGHGLSDASSGPCSIRDHAGDLDALLERLGLGNVILAGVSIGGMIAMDYAITHPSNVRALVLGDAVPRIGAPDAWTARIDAIARRGLADVAPEIVPRWFAPDFARRCPDIYQGMLNMLLRMSEAAYIASCAAVRDGDLTQSVKSIKIKALVLCGDSDVATPPDQVRAFSELLPDSRFALIDQAGHLPCVEQPQAVADEINRFLEANGYAR